LQLGVFTPVFAKLSFPELLKTVARFKEITALEIGTGGWPGSFHIDVGQCLQSQQAARDYSLKIADAGLMISALSCHGNPLHPDDGVARKDDETFRNTVRLAERLHVPVVVTFSGCPGGGPQDRTPNWIVTPWPPENLHALDWQWEQKVIPYWSEAAQFAANSGVKIALEAHPGFSVYNTETLLRLRAATSPSLGINLDPSHLYWQGMDIPVVIDALKDAIFHVHAKDVYLSPAQIARNGVLDGKSYTLMRERSWLFRSVGWGHGELEWKAIASALRLAGYDYVMSIEHEDALASVEEGLRSAVSMLSRVILKEPPVEAWWT
jgi:sugar phosphate isomerase/epimerase